MEARITQIVAFDIGVRNFAYCILHRNEDTGVKEVQHVDVVDLGTRKGDTQRSIDACLDLLDDLVAHKMNLQLKTIVLIESQMTASMKALQTAINVFFKMLVKYESADVATKYMSAKLKLQYIEQFPDYQPELVHSSKTKSSYKKNKLDAVQFAEWLLKEKLVNDGNGRAWQRISVAKKKDDMCDAALMAFAA